MTKCVPLLYFLLFPFTNQYVTNGFQNQMLTFSHEKRHFFQRTGRQRGRRPTFILLSFTDARTHTDAQSKPQYMDFIKSQQLSAAHFRNNRYHTYFFLIYVLFHIYVPYQNAHIYFYEQNIWIIPQQLT